MIHARIGTSEAGKRIHAAGIAFNAPKGPFPDPALVALVQAALDEPTEVRVTCREVAARVAAEHGFTLADITSASRARGVMAARFEAYYRCLVETQASATEVGLRLGDRNHCTIISGASRHCAEHGIPMPRGLASRHHPR